MTSPPDWGHAEPLDGITGQVAIAGIGEADHSKASGRATRQIAAEAVERAIADAGLTPADIDGIMWHPAFTDQFDDAAFREHFGTTHEMWTSPQGGGMVWAGTAPHTAARALKEKRARYIVNAFAVAWATQRSSMTGGPGQSHAQQLMKSQYEVPFGWFPQPVYFATVARRHMHEYGTTAEQLGAVAVTTRRHANLTPAAVMHDRGLTLDQYLASPPVAEPFRKEDCSLISDGGGAYIMTSPERARDLPGPVVEVAGVGLGTSATGGHWAQQSAFTTTPQVFAAPGAFAMAGLTPADVDVLACYDPFTIVSLMQIEDLGFCAKGEAGPLAASGGLAYDGGGVPYNTHGGLLSHSYVLGIAHVVELVRQLRGTAAAQVPGAETAVYGGYTGPQASALVLRRAR
ncbi:thiolase family protein [Yinghuangia sp. YIM S09857]|uniref:thiolase family protein n=1 Tax=Yinghuangia sp. YIM S09857 TaxID=3436929 RepID=UPI003F53CAF6